MDSDIPGHPIQFIDIDQDEDNKKYNFNINPDAIAVLQELKDKKVGVLVIAGPQRSGKSFLANKILDQVKGFHLGSSVQPCTKGIWMWSQPIKLNEEDDFETLVIDTEGLNSVQRDVTLDSKIFTISLLLSSAFVYNSLGHIDEQALDNLSLVVNLAKYIDASKNGEEGSNDFSVFFPFFTWVLRDFSLDLKERSANEYLNHCLTPLNDNSPEAIKKNQIRTTINNYFKHRDCHCLVRPVNDEKKLQHIEEVPETSMRPEFLEGLEDLKRKIKSNMKPKIINGKTLTGNMLLNLTFEYIEALNNETAPNIYSSLERIVHAETRKACDEVLNQFYEEIGEEFEREKMPLEEEFMKRRYRDFYNKALKKFELMTKDYAELTQLIDLREEIVSKMENEFESKVQTNDDLSQYLCKKLVNELFNSFNLPSLLSMEDIRESFVMEYKQKFLMFYENYKKFAKGPHKFNIFADFAPNFLFEFFDKYQANVNRIHLEELNNLRVALSQARAGEANLRKNLEENYDLITHFQRDKDQARRDMEKNIRENHLNSLLKQDEITALQDQIKELNEKVYKKKLKSQELKRKNENNELSIEKYKTELTAVKLSQSKLQDEIIDYKEQSLNSSNQSFLNTTGTTPVLPDLMSNLIKQFDVLRNSLPVYENAKRPSNNSGAQLEKEAEIAQVKKDYERRLNENWDRIRLIKEDYQKDIDQLRRQLESQMGENAKLKVQVIDQIKVIEGLQKKDQVITRLDRENQALMEENDLKKNDYKVSLEVTEMFKVSVESLQLKLQELEGKIGEQASEIARLKAQKMDVLYATKNALKKVLNQRHYLKQAFENLDQETANEMRDMFTELGLKLKY